MNIKDWFRINIPEKPLHVPPGIYHFRREAGGVVTRFHLRVEGDGSGVLLANASMAARLSPTGVLIAKARLEGVAYPVISKMMKDHFYGATETQIEADVRKIARMIGELANLEDNTPIFNLDDPELLPPRNLLAPFHAQMPVADPDQINPLLQKLWDSGIMHVTFTMQSGQNSFALRNVERAEDLGMISGVRAMPSAFLQSEFFANLARAGVDYTVAPAISPNGEKQDSYLGEGATSQVNDWLHLCHEWEVTPVFEVPVLQANLLELEQIVNEFSAKGGRNILFYAIASEHQPEGLAGVEMIRAAAEIAEATHRSRVRYVWLPAVSAAGDLKMILRNGPRSAGDVSIRVEAEGSVYPPRGPYQEAGNLRSESFHEIWGRDVFQRYRERVESPTHCEICPGLEICGADCPGDPAGWQQGGPA